jgi:hypothetical protein
MKKLNNWFWNDANFITIWLIGWVITGLEFYMIDSIMSVEPPNWVNAVVSGCVFGFMFTLLIRLIKIDKLCK